MVQKSLNRIISPYAARIRVAEVCFVPQRFIVPLQLSTGVIEEVTEARVTVEVESNRDHQIAIGRGSIYLSDLWAWPDPEIEHSLRDNYLRQLCEEISCNLPLLFGEEFLHPLEIGLRLHEWTCHQISLSNEVPLLARAMCSSPFDAAIHDAVGHAIGQSAFQFYDDPVQIASADGYFQNGGVSRAIKRLFQKPRTKLPAWFLVSKNDELNKVLPQAIKRAGYCCFKLKITGKDNEEDANRTIEVFQVARSLGIDNPRITIDSNEGNPNAESVKEYLDLLEQGDRGAFAALEYIEQPTGRNIEQHSYDWRQVTSRKPVLLDEGLTDLISLETALMQGWSGFALKTCKGHSMLLTSAAWGYEHNMLLSLQDLTNPGISLIHAALVGAYLPTVNGAELNSPQFTPDANLEFLPRLGSLFEPTGGYHTIAITAPLGLGSSL